LFNDEPAAENLHPSGICVRLEWRPSSFTVIGVPACTVISRMKDNG
jgi:hypothetical protein